MDDILKLAPQQELKQHEETENMIKLMQEIQGLKEKNKVISDEERRQNAENIIMRLAKWMDISDEEFSDEE